MHRTLATIQVTYHKADLNVSVQVYVLKQHMTY